VVVFWPWRESWCVRAELAQRLHDGAGRGKETWTSCPYARAILRLLDAHHDRWAHVLYAYPGAGHPVGTLVPDEPTSPVADPDYATDQQARALLWPHLLTFLAGLAHNPAG
jgi:hypothetical protein